MNYYILTYDTTPTYLEERTKYRKEHLERAKQSQNDGHLVMGGALEEPADKAILIFKGENEDAVKEFAENDPYVKNGLVKKWYVRKWNVVVGNE